jgi:hypothetical protein
MPNHKIGNASASENVAKRSHKSITSDKKLEVIRRMDGGQSHPTVCRDLNMAHSNVTTIMKNVNKIKKTTKLQEGRLLQLLGTYMILCDIKPCI